MSESSTRGGRRPRAGRKPGTGTGTNPRITERVPADLAAYCKAMQCWSPGYLAGLIRADMRAKSAGLESSDMLPEAKEIVQRYLKNGDSQ